MYIGIGSNSFWGGGANVIYADLRCMYESLEGIILGVQCPPHLLPVPTAMIIHVYDKLYKRVAIVVGGDCSFCC